MTENDYLNPNEIKAQCDAAIMRLERDNDALTRVENALEQFINDDEIKSVAYDALKQQISDYKVLLQAMQDANCSDISDFTVLKASVGDDVLIGADILAQKQASWDARISDENAAEGYRRASYTAEWPWISQYYSWMANHYEQMVQIDIRLYNEWQTKEDAFNAIEASTRCLFQSSAQLRQTAQNGLQSITGAFSNGTYVPDMGATWRTELTQAYINRMMVIDAFGTTTIHWTEVEKVLSKDVTEITDVEYETLAAIYLKADEEGMARFLACCMDRKSDVDIPWYNEALGPSAGLLNEDYSEWVVNEKKIGQIQTEIVARSEELLAQMREIGDSYNPDYQNAKNERNNVLQRLSLVSVVAGVGTFRGEYQGTHPMISITKGEERELIVTFNEFRNVGSESTTTMSNLGESTVTIDFTINGDSIIFDKIRDSEVAFKAYFCNYSAEKDVVKFVYNKTNGEVISQGSKKLSEYIGETLGKETLGKVVGTVPIVGDIAGLGMDVVMEQVKQEYALEFIEGQFRTMDSANIYEDFDCSVNDVHFDTTENTHEVLYAYEGEKTEERVRRVNEILQTELEIRISKEDVVTNPNSVYDLYLELLERNPDNQDRYDEAVNDK